MKKIRCPYCKEWAEWEANPFRPFCGERCKKLDLGNWATQKYRMPVIEEDPDMNESMKKKESEED